MLSLRLLSPTTLQRRSFVTLRDHISITQATAEGNGRSGHVYTTGRDPPLDLRMHPSKDMGGVGRGHNPEQLFAMAYSSCFLESLQNSLCRAGKGDAAHDVKVHTSVYTGHYTDSPELGLKVHITIEGVEDDDAIIEAQKKCMYSRALMEGIEVKLMKA